MMSDRRTEQERRERRERRRPKERRRNADSRIAVIELTESELRVAILNRGDGESADQVEGLTHRWRHESHSLGSDEGRTELATALRYIGETHGLVGSQIRFVLGCKYCVTRAFLGPNEEIKSQLQQLQQRSQLYLLLGAGEKVIVSNSRPLDARHTYAVAAIANARTIDTIYKASEQAGLLVNSIEPALVANSRVVGRLEGISKEPCLLIHIDQDSVEVGVSQEGRLLLEYRPGTCETSSDLVEVVRTHLNRLERHIGRMLRQTPPKFHRIYLTGEKVDVDRAQAALGTLSGIEAVVPRPEDVQTNWILNSGSEDTTTITQLGALLGSYLPASEIDAPNFMDHINAITRMPMRPILLRSFLPLAAVLLLAVGMLSWNFHMSLVNKDLQLELNELADAQTQTRELKLQMTASSEKLAQLEVMLAQLKSPPLADMIRRIARCMPSDVWVNSLAVSKVNSVEMRGSSYLEAGVFDFVRWLELAPGFENVALRSTKSGQTRSGRTVDFEVGLGFATQETPISEVASNE